MTKEEILDVTLILLQYLVPTLKLFGFTLLFSIPLGMIVALLKMCKFKPISWLTNIYILIMRGTPLMLQIIAIYYAIPYLKINENLPDFLKNILSGIDIQGEGFMFRAVLTAFVLNYAAYFAEIFRGGIESISKGQYEAARQHWAFGRAQTFFHIILPQVIKRIVPASSNEVVILVKDTSLANIVAYAEITLKAQQQMQIYSSLTPLFIAGVFYFIISMIMTVIFAFIERKLNYYK